VLTILTGFPENVLAVSASGEVTAEEYRKLLLPAARAGMRDHTFLNLFCYLGPEFTGVTSGAMWEDTKLGMAHWGSWGRVAVVSDVRWIKDTVRIFAPLFHHPVRVFPLAESEAARRWIAESEVKAA